MARYFDNDSDDDYEPSYIQYDPKYRVRYLYFSLYFIMNYFIDSAYYY